ncbi:MAG: ArsA-related P-loop ATPase [Actinomycetota bacterium]
MTDSLNAARLAIVSGKGGVGKTTVAAALALAAARAGKRVLLVEVEQRESLAPLFGHAAIGYEEKALAPNVTGLSVIPDEALVEYLYLFYGIRYVGRVLRGSKAVEFATNVAPGLRDILLIGKIKEAERRRTAGQYAFDLIVLDAPPTGRLPRFLEAPRSVVELVRSGPIRQQAQGVLDMVSDPKRTQVVLVTLPEDMPVRETAEAAEKLGKMGVTLGPVVVNGVYPEVLPADALVTVAAGAQERLKEEAGGAGIRLSDEAVEELARVGGAHARRTINQHDAIAELDRETGLPKVMLPYLFAPRMGKDEIGRLADDLAAQGAIR